MFVRRTLLFFAPLSLFFPLPLSLLCILPVFLNRRGRYLQSDDDIPHTIFETLTLPIRPCAANGANTQVFLVFLSTISVARPLSLREGALR